MQFRELGGEWPTVNHVERQLGGLDDEEMMRLLGSVPGALLKPLESTGAPLSPGERLILTIGGVSQCAGSHDDIENFLNAVRWLSGQAKDYDPPDGDWTAVPIMAEELARALSLPRAWDPNSVRRLIALLEAEGLVQQNVN